ncbi:MAG: PAS domain S-box protein [Deltaproteobacteria bacterium]|nr:PAS domain S-box protein [Deltaproteobacteria bacterium]
MNEKPTYEELERKLNDLERALDGCRSERMALRETKAYYQAFFEQGAVGIVILDPETARPIEFNTQVCRQLGYTADEFSRLSIKDIDVLETEEDTRKTIQGVMERGYGEFETLQRTKQGEIRYVHVFAQLVNVEGQKFYHCIWNDITERKLAEQALRESREEMAEIFSMSPDMICVADINTATFLKVNPAFTKTLGFPEEELLGRPFLDFIHPDDVESTIAVVSEKLKAGEEVVEFLNRYRCADGSYRWLEWVSRPLPERGVTFAVAHDITRRKRTEEALQESEAFNKLVMDNLPIGLAVNSKDTFVYMNDNFPRFYRTTREMLENPDFFWEAVYEDPEFRREMKKRVWNDCASGDSEKMQWENVPIARKGQETTFVSARNILLPGKDLMVSLVWDVTRQKRMEEEKEKLQVQFQQVQKLESVGRLAGGVAHDLNNLLSPIIGFSEILLDDFAHEDPRRESVQEIVQAGNRARDIVRQLLAFSRKQAMEFKSLNLAEVVGRFRTLLRKTIREDIEIQVASEPALPLVRGDVGQLEQVLMNLAINAQDAMPDGGELTIEIATTELDEDYASVHQGAKPGAYVCLSISDTGQGIDPEICKHIFEPFFTTKGRDEGTGLGLAMVYGIVKQHEGYIWLYSELAKGTTFKIYLPVSKESVSQHKETVIASRNLQGDETVLLVEDSEPVRYLAGNILKRKGYAVIVAENGEAALAKLENYHGPVHLLLTDVVMPGMSGKDLFERLSRRFPDMKVLYMSGYTEDVIVHRGVVDEGVNFIQKPFSVNTLATKIREVLEN